MKQRLERIKELDHELYNVLCERYTLMKDIVQFKRQDNNINTFNIVEDLCHPKVVLLDTTNDDECNDWVLNIFHGIQKEALNALEPNGKRQLIVKTPRVSGFYEHFCLNEDEKIVIAGPCAVENEAYLEKVAANLVKNKVKFIRGGAFKPRTSPYEFQGIGEDGLKLLHKVAKRHTLKVVTEVVDTKEIELVSKYADVLQIGARNMHNFELLKAVGKTQMPVLLKRGLSAKLEEWIYAAEYIANEGNLKILMCERGVRSFETATRNMLDIASAIILKEETHLPVIVDISHSLGRKDIVIPIGRGALAAGLDGIMVEVHPELGKPYQIEISNCHWMSLTDLLKRF